MKNKIKTITKVLLVSILLLGSTTKVFALRITWNEITTKFKATFDDAEEISLKPNVTITSDDTNLHIVGKGDNSNYTLDFKYENNVISLVPRDKTNLSEKQQADYSFSDIVIAGVLLQTVADLYEYDLNNMEINNQENKEEYEEYGIYAETTKIEYEDPDTGLTSSGDYIDSFSIDLDKFEKKIDAETKNVDKNSQTGATTMVISWIIGLSALIFAVVYINKTFKTEETC